MRSDVLPVIGDMKVSEIHRRDIHRVLDPIKERGSPAMAGKVYADLRAMFRWAVARGYLDQSPVTGMEEDDGSKARTQFLTEEEIAALWPALSMLKDARSDGTQTRTRHRATYRGSMRHDRGSELDLPKAVWTIPAERSKNGETHTVPLSDMALELIAEARSTAINGRLISRSSEAVAQALLYKIDRLPVQVGPRTICDERSALTLPRWVSLRFTSAPLSIIAKSPKAASRSASMCNTITQGKSARRSICGLIRLQAIIGGKGAKIIPILSMPLDVSE